MPCFGALLLELLFISAGSAAALDDFPVIVSEILQSQTEGRISEMGPEQKQAMIDCVNEVLADLPNGRKRYILAGMDFEEREERFGKVLYENRAEWVQNIARACSGIAMSGRKTDR